eukprot:3305804-Alexandrium_andersonii.AAC.1
MLQLLRAHGGQVKHGKAKQGQLETRLQTLLDGIGDLSPATASRWRAACRGLARARVSPLALSPPLLDRGTRS